VPIIFEFLATHPAPMIVTNGTVHMVTALVFFNGSLASRALVRVFLVNPAFVKQNGRLTTGFSLVPRNIARKANISLAFITFDLLCVLTWGLNHIFTAWIRTKLLKFVLYHFIVRFESLVLGKSFCIKHHSQKFISYRSSALMLGASQLVALPCFFDFIVKVVLKSREAKFMSTGAVCYELVKWVVLVANRTVFL